MSKAVNLVREIRSSTDSEQLDLSGFEKDQVNDLFRGAFEKPFERSDMIRFTFVIGGGKGCRQKYRDDLGKDCAEALRELGFEEDRAASLCLSSAGFYKQQHDTDKNLKFLHVYPRIKVPAAKDAGQDEEEDGESEALTPEMLCVQASFDTYTKMVCARAPSFTKKRTLLQRMTALAAECKELESKLVGMVRLTDKEQERYDMLSEGELSEKVTWLKERLEAIVDAGDLSADEQNSVLKEFEKKLSMVDTMIASVPEGSKKAAALSKQREVVLQKIDAVRAVRPVVRVGKHDKEIRDLMRKLKALDVLENKKTKAPSDIQKLLARPGLENKLERLQAEDRTWFK